MDKLFIVAHHSSGVIFVVVRIIDWLPGILFFISGFGLAFTCVIFILNFVDNLWLLLLIGYTVDEHFLFGISIKIHTNVAPVAVGWFIFLLRFYLLLRDHNLLGKLHESSEEEGCDDDQGKSGRNNGSSFSEYFSIIWNFENKPESNGSSDHASIGNETQFSKINAILLGAQTKQAMCNPYSSKTPKDDYNCHPNDKGHRPFMGKFITNWILLGVCKHTKSNVGKHKWLSCCSKDRNGYTRYGLTLWRQVVPGVVSHNYSTSK